MAAGEFEVYENGLLNLLNGSVNFGSDTIKAALLTSSYTPNLATHDNFDDVSAAQCADSGYAQQTLASKTVAIASGKVRFDCADIDFGNSVSLTAKYLVIFKDTGTASTSRLLFLCDLNSGGGSVSSTSGNFDIAINASGIHEVTPNA